MVIATAQVWETGPIVHVTLKFDAPRLFLVKPALLAVAPLAIVDDVFESAKLKVHTPGGLHESVRDKVWLGLLL